MTDEQVEAYVESRVSANCYECKQLEWEEVDGEISIYCDLHSIQLPAECPDDLI